MATDFAWFRDDSRHAYTSSSQTSSQSVSTDSPPNSLLAWESARHSRFPSSNSSLSSSPSLRSSQESFAPNRKILLGDLPEIDEDAQQEIIRAPSPSSDRPSYEWTQDVPKPRPTSFFHSFQVPARRDGYSSETEVHWTKRRKSSDSTWDSFATGMVERFPSLSKLDRHKKRASTSFLDNRSQLHSPLPVGPTVLRRSGSQPRSLRRVTPPKEPEPLHFEQAEDIMSEEHEEIILESQGANPPVDMAGSGFAHEALIPQLDGQGHSDNIENVFESEPRSTTPILPPLMSKTHAAPVIESDIGSPLQSPTVASHSGQQSVSHTPDGTPQHSAVASPTLSTSPSIASIHRSHPSMQAQWNEVPPLVIADPRDEWAEKLGHANFSILPMPYVPEHCDEASCRKLVEDWEKARDEYAKHRSRTETHFGGFSRTFKLTEEKWAHIDAQWKMNKELATRRAIEAGTKPSQSPKEPAPLAKIPHIDDPRMLQSEEIPGPMKIEEPVNPNSAGVKRSKSKRKQFLKLFTGFQFPSKALNRSAGGSEDSQ